VTLTMADEKMLHQMGITAKSEDPHHGCLIRWIEERGARERAEAATAQNAQAYEVIRERLELDVNMWQCRTYWACVVAGAAVVCALVVAFAR